MSRWLKLLLITAAASAAPTEDEVRYDQSQKGDTNIQVDLRNVHLLAIVDSLPSFQDDYDYDYNHMTLKPPPSHNKPDTTAWPSNGTTENHVLSSLTNETQSTLVASSTQSTISSSTTQTSGLMQEGSETPGVVDASALPTAVEAKRARRCGAGFYRDQTGRCRRVRRTSSLSGLLNKLQGTFRSNQERES